MLQKQELRSWLQSLVATKSHHGCGAASQVDEDYHWGTFPVGFPPFFAFSLPNTSRKADLGG